jgi:antitoxin component of RelBE/YafQ-DinJ toxin-antitoxin module
VKNIYLQSTLQEEWEDSAYSVLQNMGITFARVVPMFPPEKADTVR